jgi:SAM-dependent methyltransferase
MTGAGGRASAAGPEPRRSLLDVVEGFYLSEAVDFLHRSRLLDQLAAPRAPAELAASTGFEEERLALVLEYVARRSDVVDEVEGRYRRGGAYGDGALLAFELDQYLGAYGPNVRRLHEALSSRQSASSLVDRDRHARAFGRLERPSFSMLPGVLAGLEVHRLLDLGCGTGSLLLAMARADSGFRGWGIDASPAMCARAGERLAAAGCDDRVAVLEGDATDPAAVLAAAGDGVAAEVEAVTAASLVNELCGDGGRPAVEWLRKLRSVLPGRLLVIADYYGRLGRGSVPASRKVLLHDLVQVLSGQGVPPADLAGWRRLYEEAGCRLLDAHDGEGEIPWLIHLVRL